MRPNPNLGMPHPITPYPKLIINAAITGMIPTRRHTPHVPLTVDEIIRDATACVDAGASILHVHARDKDGVPTYKKEIYGDIIRGIRARRPEAIICASTSGRTHNTFECRSEVLELTGEAKPDMASLTLSSLNFPTQASVNQPDMVQDLAMKMKSNGIMPELEAFDTGMINAAKVLIKKGVLVEPFYINLLLGSIYSAPGTIPELAHMVQSLPADMQWAGAGIGKFQLKMNFTSVLMGGHVRVGLEDNIFYDTNGKELATNVRLIDRIVRFAQEIGREIATPNEVRESLGMTAVAG